MGLRRKGEEGHSPFRSARVFNVGTEWYFATREGKDVGPFESKDDAEAELALYLRKIAMSDQEIRGD
ncbi:MAG: DUF6316 family protein [Gammaproteobacteria bacterium]|nr:DUF6316 family protein [Gammaproteobacteria bacterium]MDH5594694.1 DUF6316 family protein [Gammaproteobacteria bacterium]MDH5614526.1 DUF6316 family protein [Gammaproteobacteria bacterium]